MALMGESPADQAEYIAHFGGHVNRMRALLAAAPVLEPRNAIEWVHLGNLLSDDALRLLAAAAENEPMLRAVVKKALA